MKGYLRSDGRKGIRNSIVVVYSVECAHHVAKEVAFAFDDDVQVIGFGGCFPNEYAATMLDRLCTHPNVGGVLIVSLGCEGFNRQALENRVAASGRPVKTLVIQENGGTRTTVELGREFIEETRREIASVEKVDIDFSDLVIGTICGGSDSTSGISANPGVGLAFDILSDAGSAVIFEETGELIGCEYFMEDRAVTPELGKELVAAVHKAERVYETLGYPSFAPGNAEGGLTTIEEKSLGAYAKSGSRPIAGLVKPGDIPPKGGVYLLDVIPDGEVRWGFPNINDNAEAAELMACGAHMILFTTGRGSVVGSAISPIVKVCANPETYRRMSDDMDVDAGRVLESRGTLEDVGDEIVEWVRRVAAGEKTASERLGHREFVLTYKSFDPIGPSCLPN